MLIFASSTESAAISWKRTLLRSPKNFRLPPKSTNDPVTMEPLAITVVSPERTPSSTRNRSGRPTSALMGTSSRSAIRKGSPSFSCIGTTTDGAAEWIAGADGATVVIGGGITAFGTGGDFSTLGVEGVGCVGGGGAASLGGSVTTGAGVGTGSGLETAGEFD